VPTSLTLLADVPHRTEAGRIPPGYTARECRRTDIDALGRMYFEAYDPGQACASLAEAVADVEASFAGEYSPLWPGASPMLVTDQQQPAAAIMVVERAPWPDTPDCPFIIELFTARAHRRRGLGRWLIRAAMDAVATANRDQLALRVASDNDAALGLYRSLGFRQWTPEQPVTG
jgi:N-alpha-acetyltransferase 10/11